MVNPICASHIPATITYLEKEARGEAVGINQKNREIEELYISSSEILHLNLSKLVNKFGDSPTVRQIIFFHYLEKQPVIKELFCRCIYPSFQQRKFFWQESQLRLFIHHYGLTKSEQTLAYKCLEGVLAEMKIPVIRGNLHYQRPTIETVAYAFYAEYGEGSPASRRFSLKNPPLQQIIDFAAFPAYFLIDPQILPAILEICRLKDYLTLEFRGGLNQYALLFQDLSGLVDFIIRGGIKPC